MTQTLHYLARAALVPAQRAATWLRRPSSCIHAGSRPDGPALIMTGATQALLQQMRAGRWG